MITHQFIYKHVHNSILNLYKYNYTHRYIYKYIYIYIKLHTDKFIYEDIIIFKHSSLSKKIIINEFFSQTVFIIRTFFIYNSELRKDSTQIERREREIWK